MPAQTQMIDRRESSVRNLLAGLFESGIMTSSWHRRSLIVMLKSINCITVLSNSVWQSLRACSRWLVIFVN